MKKTDQLKTLEACYAKYNRAEYIHPDPVEFVHRYADPADREIVGLIAASLAYGNVKYILTSVARVLEPMGQHPAAFLRRADRRRLASLYAGFRHRWTTAEELVDFLIGIKGCVKQHGCLEQCFTSFAGEEDDNFLPALDGLVRALARHSRRDRNSLLPAPLGGSACKRLHMYLRWMIRKDTVDFGDWAAHSPSKLIVPLDVHMHRLCREMGLTSRRQPTLLAALEVTEAFRRINADDPVRYDFSLTRTGILKSP